MRLHPLLFSCFAVLLILPATVFAQKKKAGQNSTEILPGAYQLNEYLPLLKNKRVAVFANHTATVGNTHLVDTLKAIGVNIVKAFGPEHGFRGNVDAGDKIDNGVDPSTGIPVISLYGKKRKPDGADLADVDVLIFDIQDVGTRFYTYISSLEEYIESAIQHDKPLIVLDRPNPNGFYVDGPVLDSPYKSFVGMQPVPVVYGMTIGEYAKMLLGEAWLDKQYIRKESDQIYMSNVLGFEKKRKQFKLTVIKCKNYTHKSKYRLPVKPSPNLPDMGSIYWYSSTCYFEGTALSEGRGTEKPFQIFGHPDLPKNMYAFTPISRDGAKEPKLKDKLCYGWNISGEEAAILKSVEEKGIQLDWLVEAYKLFPNKDQFFLKPKSGKPTDYFFNKLAGNDDLRQQLMAGKTAAEIKASWQPDLQAFKQIRKKYLLYPDFE
jgi:uncharacterized protein YbbC (DUF1343 family)